MGLHIEALMGLHSGTASFDAYGGSETECLAIVTSVCYLPRSLQFLLVIYSEGDGESTTIRTIPAYKSSAR